MTPKDLRNGSEQGVEGRQESEKLEDLELSEATAQEVTAGLMCATGKHIPKVILTS